MKKNNNNILSRYMPIVYLCVMLLFAQTFSLYMHLQHNETTTTNHILVDYNEKYDGIHQNGNLDQHHFDEFGINEESEIKEIEFFSSSLLMFFIISILLYLTWLLSTNRQYIQSIFTTYSFLLYPPLRAPPE